MNSQTPRRIPPPAEMQQYSDEVADTLNILHEAAKKHGTLLGFLGFGHRVVVRGDLIYHVVGDGVHSWVPGNEGKIFGAPGKPSIFWENGLTQKIPMTTRSFPVLINGTDNTGVEAFDSTKVSFRLQAFAVAKLDPEKAEIAAQRVGSDMSVMTSTVTRVGTAALVAAAANMTLQEIMQNRQQLADQARPLVNQALVELGYDLVLLNITYLGGDAVDQLVNEAGARIAKETGLKTNAELLAKTENDASKEEEEARIGAEKRQRMKEEDFKADETIRIRQHELDLQQVGRNRAKAEQDNQLSLRQAELAQEVSMVEVSNEAAKREAQMQRDADIRKEQQQRNAAIALAEQQAADEKARLAQENALKREAERVKADAERLAEEEREAASRRRQVREIEATTEAQAREIGATAEAAALRIEATAQAEKTRTVATAQADAAEQEAKAIASRAQASIREAEATRAKTAAQGLAEAEVAERQAEVAVKQAEADKAKGLVDAEVTRAKAAADAEGAQLMRQVEIDAQRALAELYAQNPVLVDLEKLNRTHDHEQALARMQLDAKIAMMAALAPQLDLHAKIIGNGTQMGAIMGQIMTLASGYDVLSEEVPMINGIFQPNGGNAVNVGSIMRGTSDILGGVLKDVNPRMFGALTLSNLVDRMIPVVEGESDLQSFLVGLKEDTNFNVVGNIPIAQLISRLLVNGQTDQPSEGEVDAKA